MLVCRVIDLSHDQDSTDLMKCLQCAKHELERRGHACHAGMTILVLGASCPCYIQATLPNKQNRRRLPQRCGPAGPTSKVLAGQSTDTQQAHLVAGWTTVWET